MKLEYEPNLKTAHSFLVFLFLFYIEVDIMKLSGKNITEDTGFVKIFPNLCLNTFV